MTDEVALEPEVEADPVVDPVEEETPKEKTLPVSRVEELVKKAKLKGRDQLQAEIDAVNAENAQLKEGQDAGSMGGMAAPVDIAAIEKNVMATLEKRFQDAQEAKAAKELDDEAQQIAADYRSKMSTGKDTYDDFDEVMADFNPKAFPNLVYLANQVENTPAVMYELMQNPNKWATLAVLSERDPEAAQKMIGRISGSIQANQQAKAEDKDVSPPLGRLSSTPTGQDNGKLGIRDYKRMFRT